MANNSLCIGIDLGTTNSLIASCREENGKIKTPVKMVSRVVDSRGTKRNDMLLPSCIYYQQGNAQSPIVGDFAKSMYASLPYRVSKSIKSQMGQAKIVGIDDDIPDKHPEEVSARIIKHLVADLEQYYDEEIKDVVITVPASFDPAQRLATLKAAEIAGIDVKNADGSYNQNVLLSEPEAVMYYLLNQIKKGECDIRLDFSTKKNILVYDIGGGTLDITVHSVQGNEKNSDVLNIDLIATNRFTPVAGDTFDKLVAEEMFNRYVDYYQQVKPAIVPQIKQDKKMMLSSLEAHAEELKLKLNVRYDDSVFRHKPLSNSVEFDCGGRMPNDYPYDDYFTKGDYEKCVNALLGKNYSFADYKTIEGKEQTNDIIWPLLDVLRKASKKLGTPDVKIDAILISGGMSRFYLIKNRLEEFFGTHIISVPDPDTAVAQGAVVYHFHQHQNEELMRKIHSGKDPFVKNEEDSGTGFLKIGKKVLADPIFLGLKGGENIRLADEGQDLPFSSQKITGLKIDAGQQLICVPIQKKGFGKNSFVTIASGNIKFSKTYSAATPVAIRFDISEGQIITIEAWTSTDTYGQKPIEKGSVTFSFGGAAVTNETQTPNSMSAVLPPPTGPKLNPSTELSSLKRFSMVQSTKIVRGIKKKIYSCGNPNEFAKPIITALSEKTNNTYYYLSLIVVARKLSAYWSESEKKEIANLCLKLLKGQVQNTTIARPWYSVFGEAITIIGICGSSEQVEALYQIGLINEPSLYLAHVNAFAMRGVYLSWINQVFYESQKSRNIALSAIGMAIGKSSSIPSDVSVERIARDVEALMLDTSNNLAVSRGAIITIGYICGNAQAKAILGNARIVALKSKVQTIDPERFSNHSARKNVEKAKAIASTLMEGKQLSTIQEQYLLGLLDDDDDDSIDLF